MPSLAKITDGNTADALYTSCQSTCQLKLACINSTSCQIGYKNVIVFLLRLLSAVYFESFVLLHQKNPLSESPLTFHSTPVGCWEAAGRMQYMVLQQSPN